MKSRLELTHSFLDSAFQTLAGHLRELSLEEALFVPAGGYRSVLGTLKHAAGWSHVYHSYAFDRQPVAWERLSWPAGLRDRVIQSQAYLLEVIEWLHQSHGLWMRSLVGLRDEELDDLRPVHWGDERPSWEIIQTLGNHHIYHAGEINQLLSIYRGEAWEEGEEVEENITPSEGHRVVYP